MTISVSCSPRLRLLSILLLLSVYRWLFGEITGHYDASLFTAEVS